VEDKDRTKELADAIAQGFQTYGMQSFDQSLMGLVKQNLISYEEARRQATNPDDFALRFSGISATSDSKWDDFEGKEQAVPVVSASPPPPSAPRPGAPPPSAPRPAAPASEPTSPAGGDDFQIERF